MKVVDKMDNKDLISLRNEYTITKCEKFEFTYEIEQNLWSISLMCKSILYANPKLVYFCTMLNCFQNLENYTEENPIFYESFSHALTTYGLKLLERNNMIQILSCTKSEDCDLTDYYRAIGSPPRKMHINMYDIVFYKLRSFSENDVPLLEQLAAIFHIDYNQLLITSTNHKLHLSLKKSFILNNILHGYAFQSFQNEVSFLLGTNGLLYDLFDNLKHKTKLFKI